MLRSSVTLVVLFVALFSSGSSPSLALGLDAGETGYTVYLPQVFTEPPFLIEGITARRECQYCEYEIVGTVTNLTDSPVYSVTLEITDALWPDRSAIGYTWVPIIFPGQYSIFSASVPEFGSIDSIEAQVVSWENGGDDKYQAATILNVTGVAYPTPDSRYGLVYVTLRNDRPRQLLDLNILLAIPELKWYQYSRCCQSLSVAPNQTITAIIAYTSPAYWSSPLRVVAIGALAPNE